MVSGLQCLCCNGQPGSSVGSIRSLTNLELARSGSCSRWLCCLGAVVTKWYGVYFIYLFGSDKYVGGIVDGNNITQMFCI